MSVPTPRYQIGDVVFMPRTSTVTDRLPCPDCHGTRRWSVKSPAGLETEIPCPRCSPRSFQSNQLPSLEYQKFTAWVEPLTIGSIRIDTAEEYRDVVQYMRRETGIGSGQIYQQSKLYSTQEEALAAAQAMADEGNAKIVATAEHITKLDMSMHTVDVAAMRGLRDAHYNAWSAYRRLKSDIEELVPEDGSDVGDVGEFVDAIRDALRFDAKYRDKPALDRLVSAAVDAMEAASLPELRSAYDALPDALKARSAISSARGEA